MIIWGWGSKVISQILCSLQCSHCKHDRLIMIALQRFFNLFFMPTLPLAKSYSFVCPNCSTEYHPATLSIDLTKLPTAKTPWWGFSGAYVIAVFVGLGIFFDMSEEQQRSSALESPQVNDVMVIKSEQNNGFPYALVKIKTVNNEGLVISTSRHAYARLRHAKTAASDASSAGDFLDEEFEIPSDSLKKMDVQYVSRSK